MGTQQDYYSLQKHCLVSMERLTSISTHYSSDVIQQIEEGSCHIDVSKCPPCDTYINNHLLTLDKIKLCSDTLYCAAVTWKWLFFFFLHDTISLPVKKKSLSKKNVASFSITFTLSSLKLYCLLAQTHSLEGNFVVLLP